MMEMEEINKFLEEPSTEKLEKFRQSELIEIGEIRTGGTEVNEEKHTNQDSS